MNFKPIANPGNGIDVGDIKSADFVHQLGGEPQIQAALFERFTLAGIEHLLGRIRFGVMKNHHLFNDLRKLAEDLEQGAHGPHA